MQSQRMERFCAHENIFGQSKITILERRKHPADIKYTIEPNLKRLNFEYRGMFIKNTIKPSL